MTKGGAATSLLGVLDRIESERDELLARLGDRRQEVLAGRPSPDAWSILQIVEHLVLAERSVMRGLWEPEKLRQGATGLATRLKRWLVMGILRSPIPVKVPSRSMEPKGESSLEELAAQWRESHLRLRAFLEQCGPEELRTPAFRHPVSGPLTPGEAVRMLDVHFSRHRAQIEERLRG